MASPIERCIGLLHELSGGRRRSTAELVQALVKKGIPAVTQRQIQRDLGTLERAGVPLQSERSGREQRWFIAAGYSSVTPALATHNEILALHTLKGMLGGFAHTRVGADIQRLMTKLEKHAPGTVFVGDDITSEVSPGRHRAELNDSILESVIGAIVRREWSLVEYRSPQHTTSKQFVVSLGRCVWHAGRLYVAAWHPVHKQYISLSVDRIVHVERHDEIKHSPPVFDVNEYKRGRFGVHDGNVRAIRLAILPHAVDFFTARLWHPTQKFSTTKTGVCTLTFSAPLSPELIAWVVSWADSLRIVAPSQLKTLCREKVSTLFE